MAKSEKLLTAKVAKVAEKTRPAQCERLMIDRGVETEKKPGTGNPLHT